MAAKIKRANCSGTQIIVEQHSVELFNNFITQNNLDRDNILGLTESDMSGVNGSYGKSDDIKTVNNNLTDQMFCYYESLDTTGGEVFPEKKIRSIFLTIAPKKELRELMLTPESFERAKTTVKTFEPFIKGQMEQISGEINTYESNNTDVIPDVIKYFGRTLIKNMNNQNSLFGNIVTDPNNKFSNNKPTIFDLFNLLLTTQSVNGNLYSFPVEARMTLDELLLLSILNDSNCKNCLKNQKSNTNELEKCILTAINNQSIRDTRNDRFNIFIKNDDQSPETKICCTPIELNNGLQKYFGLRIPKSTIISQPQLQLKSILSISSNKKEVSFSGDTNSDKPTGYEYTLPENITTGVVEPYSTKLNNDEITKILIICSQSFYNTINDGIQVLITKLFGSDSFVAAASTNASKDTSNDKYVININKKYISVTYNFKITTSQEVKGGTAPVTHEEPIEFEIGCNLNNNTYELIKIKFPRFVIDKILQVMKNELYYFDIHKQIQDIQKRAISQSTNDKMIEEISSLLVNLVTQKEGGSYTPQVFPFNKDQVEQNLDYPLRTYLRYTVRFDTDAYGNKKCTFIIPTGGQFKVISDKMKKQSKAKNDSELNGRVMSLITEIEKERSYCSGINSAISTNLRSGFSNLSKKFSWGGKRNTRKLNSSKLKGKKTNRRIPKKQRKTYKRR